ncbi:hypothetical protein CBR_g38013 [Chara braunii]|uniref:protein-serine/threonine phosphatase n=1 Tax=Chara braunii TaxID=69332 RepID=A0A388JZZ8_CHABU|nr:hypothetical protein CBR_g38013 [Chara braunii]|eukprot:GBG63391.1 hypothetical protein CBR_g38013 [Chara braunii]
MNAGKKSPHSSSCTSKEPSSHTESGGAYIKESNICYGYAKLQGKRAVMEDCHEAKSWVIPEQNNQRVVFFGVFDGHGGRKAADYVQKHLVNNLKDHPKLLTDTKSAIREVYLQTDEAYINMEDNGQSRDAGSTASTAVLVGKRLVVANVGDSRVVLCRKGKAHPLSTDHKPSKLEEQKRIKDAGGVIMWAGTWRVGGVLAVTRAFGDKMLKPYVSAEPEIVDEIVYPSDEFLVLASDGLWDVVSNDEAVVMVQKFPKDKPEEAAKSLTDEAYKRGSADNITCIVVRFLHDPKS